VLVRVVGWWVGWASAGLCHVLMDGLVFVFFRFCFGSRHCRRIGGRSRLDECIMVCDSDLCGAGKSELSGAGSTCTVFKVVSV